MKIWNNEFLSYFFILYLVPDFVYIVTQMRYMSLAISVLDVKVTVASTLFVPLRYGTMDYAHRIGWSLCELKRWGGYSATCRSLKSRQLTQPATHNLTSTMPVEERIFYPSPPSNPTPEF